MNLNYFPPSDILKPFVKTFMIIESENGTVNRILPETSIVMAFRLKGEVAFQENGTKNGLPSSVITGLRKSSRFIHYSKQSATLLVIFKEGGATAFLNDPLHELFGFHLGLDYLISPRKLKETEERLAEANNNHECINIVEKFLLSELKHPETDLLIQNAIKKVRFAQGNITIKKLIKELPISRDPFEKRFRRITGTSPKQFANIVRLRNVIDSYSEEKNLTTIAHSAGYFDQSHFIKDFKSFTGETPKVFFDSPSFW